jgi:uncharacterized membrane protein HdeD (DUF308 family)
MNPIVIGMVALGILLFVLGLFVVARRRKATGIVISLLGLATLITPFIITYFLFR